MTAYYTWYKVWLGLAQFDCVESRASRHFGLTPRLSSDRHDLIPPPLVFIKEA